MQHHSGLRSEVVEHGRGLVEEQRQVVLDSGRGHTISDVLVDSALGRVALQQVAPAGTQLRSGRIVHGELASRQQANFRHRVQAALAVRIKGPDAVDLVVKQVHAVGYGRAHREQVDQAAAHRVFPGTDDLGHMAVAGERELRLEFGLVKSLLGLEVERVSRQE